MRRTGGSGARAVRGRRKRQARKRRERTGDGERLVLAGEIGREDSARNFGTRVRNESGGAGPESMLQSLPTGGSPELRASFYVRWKIGFAGNREGCGRQNSFVVAYRKGVNHGGHRGHTEGRFGYDGL